MPRPGRFPFLLAISLAVSVRAAAPLDPGTRWEHFIDRHLAASARDAAPRLHPPRRAEVVLVTDASREGPTSACFTVLRDGGVIRLYYRGSVEGSDHSDAQVTRVAKTCAFA